MAIDGRVRYTKMVIRQSFLFLLKEQAIDKVTVADICRLAEINRATFYRHYENQYSILYELEQNLLDKLSPPQPEQTSEEALETAFQGLWEEQQDWAPLLAVQSHSDLSDKLFHFLGQRLPSKGGNQQAYRFLLHGLSGLVLDWMKGGFQEPAQQMTATAVQYSHDLTDAG